MRCMIFVIYFDIFSHVVGRTEDILFSTIVIKLDQLLTLLKHALKSIKSQIDVASVNNPVTNHQIHNICHYAKDINTILGSKWHMNGFN